MRLNLTAEQLSSLATHPVIAYFGIETVNKAMKQYVSECEPTEENSESIVQAMIHIAIHDHDLFFQLIEDRI